MEYLKLIHETATAAATAATIAATTAAATAATTAATTAAATTAGAAEQRLSSPLNPNHPLSSALVNSAHSDYDSFVAVCAASEVYLLVQR